LADTAKELIELNEVLKTQLLEFNSKLMTDSLASGVRGRSNKKKAKPSTTDPKEQS
jgi:hypothetical protein